MADLIKKVKVMQSDGTFTDYIPLGADAANVKTEDGMSVENKLKKKPYYFDTVADMKAATYLKNGDYIVTLGYYEANDGGAGEYEVTSDSTLIDDGALVHLLSNELYAKLIIGKNSLNVKQFGLKCNGIDDDTQKLIKAINYAKELKVPLYLDGIIYVTDTINCNGVELIGKKQPTKSGAVYPNGIGYNYPKNIGNGANITFNDYINAIVNGTAIVSDVANPILTTEYNVNFNLKNFGVYGWLRNPEQTGIKVNTTSDATVTYYPGAHKFENFSAFNFGLHGIHLHSLETVEVKNLIIELCNGYGLYVEGLNNIDCPFDYNKFENCRIRHTRLAGIKLYNTYRQGIKFSHCNFNYIGQYGFGHVNDIYGDRVLPSSNDDVIPAIDIEGLNSTNAGQGRTLILEDVYGEALMGMLKIRNIDTLQNVFVKSSSIVRVANSTSYASYFVNIKCNYLFGFDLEGNIVNVTDAYVLDITNRITSNLFIPNSIYENNIEKIFATDTRNGNKAFNNIYGNVVTSRKYTLPRDQFSHFGSAESSDRTGVVIDVTDLVTEYFKDNYSVVNGQPYTLAIFAISHGGNASGGAKCDLVAFTRHHNKIFTSFITNNTGATADTNGNITVDVPAYRIPTLQFIQQIDTSL